MSMVSKSRLSVWSLVQRLVLTGRVHHLVFLLIGDLFQRVIQFTDQFFITLGYGDRDIELLSRHLKPALLVQLDNC